MHAVVTLFDSCLQLRAWLNDTAVEEFKMASLFSTAKGGPFNAKVFETNSNYRLAIMEAVRIAYNPNDTTVSPEEADKNASLYSMALKLIHKHEPVRIMSLLGCQQTQNIDDLFCINDFPSRATRKSTARSDPRGRSLWMCARSARVPSAAVNCARAA